MNKTFGRYQIVDQLGRGAMGAVYRAIDPLIQREVAIKTLLPNVPEDMVAEVRERFLREARSAGRLSHPNIVIIFDVGEEDGVAYIAMEMLAGRSLQQMLRDPDPLPLDTTAELAAQVADALDHAHQHAIVHRDVKPANVMVAPSGRSKLTDFGVAYVSSSTLTQVGTALGSPRYMSPEHVLGGKVDPRSDVFSLGVMLYEMLVRRTPFERPGDSSMMVMLDRIAGEPHIPVREIDPRIPAAFDRILQRALAKKPEERYQRAGDLAHDLRNYRSLDRPATDDFEKTMVLQVRPAQQPVAHGGLLDEIAAFERNLERETEARKQAVEQERRKRQEELRLHAQALERKLAEQARAAKAAAEQTQGRRSSALDMLKKLGAILPPKEDPAIARARAIANLDQGMREAARYLAEFAREINAIGPRAASPYDHLYLGRLPAVSLSEAWSDSRPRLVEGRDCCEHVQLNYRIRPDSPASIALQKDAIPGCADYLKATKADFRTQVVAKSDFGEATRAVIIVRGGLLCELDLHADFDSLTVTVELKNVRRAGKIQCRVAADELKDLPDEIGRYILGADDEFEKRLRGR